MQGRRLGPWQPAAQTGDQDPGQGRRRDERHDEQQKAQSHQQPQSRGKAMHPPTPPAGGIDEDVDARAVRHRPLHTEDIVADPPAGTVAGVLVLLPPSEGKAVGVDGPPLDLASLSFPALTAVRRRLVGDLVRIARKDRPALQRALALSDKQSPELDKDALLRRAPTLPALELYTGIVYDNLSYATLDGAARTRADEVLVVASALFGLVRPTDRIPSYRLSGSTVLPGVGGLAPVWRPTLEEELRRFDLVVDLRSGAYANLARVPHAIAVRVLREEDGVRSVVSHDNKWTKGRLARALCAERATSADDVAQIARTVCDAVEVQGNRVDLLLHGLASARTP